MSNTGSGSLPSTPCEPTSRRAHMTWVLKSAMVSLAIFVGTPIVLSIAIWVAMTDFHLDSGPVDSTKPLRFTFLGRNFAIPVNYQPVLDAHVGSSADRFLVPQPSSPTSPPIRERAATSGSRWGAAARSRKFPSGPWPWSPASAFDPALSMPWTRTASRGRTACAATAFRDTRQFTTSSMCPNSRPT